MISDDDHLGMNRSISRRDFINGVAVTLASAASGKLLPAFASETNKVTFPQDESSYYPPTLKGMRGSGAGVYYIILREANGNKIKAGEVIVR